MNIYIKYIIENYFKEKEVLKSKRLLNLSEIPILLKNYKIFETNIHDIPNAKYTENTEDTILKVITNTPLKIENIDKTYYNNERKIAICITVYFPKDDLTKNDIDNIISIFELSGYYNVYCEELPHEGVMYSILYFEPYNPESTLIKLHEYLYHITPLKNNENIQKFGFIPKAESANLSYPDRVYFFLNDDRQAMINYIRYSRKLEQMPDGSIPAVIYKIKPPKNLVLYLDTHAVDGNGNIIENCVYSYDPISPDCIDDTIIIDIKGLSMF